MKDAKKAPLVAVTSADAAPSVRLPSSVMVQPLPATKTARTVGDVVVQDPGLKSASPGEDRGVP